MKIRKLMSAMTAAACVLSFAAGTGTPAVLSVSAADAPAASAVTTAVTTDATYLTGSGHFYFNSTTTTPTTDSTTFFSSGTKTNISVPGTIVNTSGPKEPAGTVMTQTTADLRNVPLQGKFNIKITIEDILGLALPALDCELIRLDTDEVVASWNTGTEPNKVVENLDYSFKRLDVTLKGDIIYALRIKNMPDHMVFYDTKMPNPIRIAGISILEFANGTNIYGNVKLCDPNYTEPAHTEVTTGIPTAADMTATTNNTTYTTVTSTVMTHITTLPTTDATYTRLTTLDLGFKEIFAIHLDQKEIEVGDYYYVPVSGLSDKATADFYIYDTEIAEIKEQDTDHLLIKALKPGKTFVAGIRNDGQQSGVYFTVIPAVTKTNTPSFILPEQNTNVTSTCISENTQPVWDESGYYRGTNALWDARLETATEPKFSMIFSNDASAVVFPVDLSKIKVNLIEERRFNINAHDVTGMLKVLGYGVDEDTDSGRYFYIEIGTDYRNGVMERIQIKPLKLKVRIPDVITADVPNGESIVSYIETAPTDTHASPDVEGTGSTTETTYVSSSGTNQPPRTSTTENTTAQKFDRGNVNCKEGTDVSDAVLLARFVAEDTDANITAEGKKNADVNGDGKLTSDDVIAILRIIAKLM